MKHYLIDFNSEQTNQICETLKQAKNKAVKSAKSTQEDIDIYEVTGDEDNRKRNLVARLKWCTTPYDADLDDYEPAVDFEEDGYFYWDDEI
jgi:hypothetical protein